jgi:Protein of unknown function (DUF2721)
LGALGAILAVMTNRLGRIIDRAHVLDDKLESVRPDLFMSLRANLAILSRRAKLMSLAITLCITTTLLGCTVIAMMFLNASLRSDATISVVMLFIGATN